MNATFRNLADLNLFAGLDLEAKKSISIDFYERLFDAGQVIVFEGEPCQAVYIVLSGLVRARRLSLEGREYVLAYLGAGEAFNIVPALDGGVHLATFEALEDTVLYGIACERFRTLVDRYPSVSGSVIKRLSMRVRYLSDRVEDLALHTVRTRLARFLLSRARGDLHAPRHWTQEEIAAHIGTVRDVVGRTLRAFSREGLIRREQGRLVVQDLAALKVEAMLEE